jgi:hypothetical protein
VGAKKFAPIIFLFHDRVALDKAEKIGGTQYD